MEGPKKGKPKRPASGVPPDRFPARTIPHRPRPGNSISFTGSTRPPASVYLHLHFNLNMNPSLAANTIFQKALTAPLVPKAYPAAQSR
jgi:hypothetical protein